ncbi:MAG: RDD family protein [Thermoproteota archaeon]|nr:RDD family protein [Thermoproteota archaeon]
MSSNTGQIDWNHWIYRLIAFVIDSLIIGLPILAIWYLVVIPAMFTAIFWGGAFWLTLLSPLLITIVMILYYTILDTVWGATIGKRILGLRVQMLNGDKVTFIKALIRNVSKFYYIVVLDWLIGILTQGPDNHQKFTDRFAGTTVVQAGQAFGSSSTPPPPPPPPA